MKSGLAGSDAPGDPVGAEVRGARVAGTCGGQLVRGCRVNGEVRPGAWSKPLGARPWFGVGHWESLEGEWTV